MKKKSKMPFCSRNSIYLLLAAISIVSNLGSAAVAALTFEYAPNQQRNVLTNPPRALASTRSSMLSMVSSSTLSPSAINDNIILFHKIQCFSCC